VALRHRGSLDECAEASRNRALDRSHGAGRNGHSSRRVWKWRVGSTVSKQTEHHAHHSDDDAWRWGPSNHYDRTTCGHQAHLSNLDQHRTSRCLDDDRNHGATEYDDIDLVTRGAVLRDEGVDLGSADCFGRDGRIARLTTHQRIGYGASSTRASMRNSPRYFRTSGTEVESGEPRLINNTPCLLMGLIEPWIAVMGTEKKARDPPASRRPPGPLDNFPPHRMVADMGAVDADRVLAKLGLVPQASGEYFTRSRAAIDANGLVFAGAAAEFRFPWH